MELPASFVNYTRSLLGEEAYQRFEEALEEEQPVSIRLNSHKLPEGFALPEGCTPVPWCASGYYLDKRLTFTFDPLFHAGTYYVQEAASMFLAQALQQYVGTEPVTMLDLCAAPGGKSTLARSILPKGSLLVANEIMRNRAQVLAENLTKWGDAGVVVTNNEAGDFAPLRECFDVILTDVPCSGEGMFRKDPVAVSEWSEANVELCWQRQRAILTDIWHCLKPGGLLIYSTCTYNTKENEENVLWTAEELGAEVLPLAIAPEWGITGNLLKEGEEPSSAENDFPVYRFLPHKTKGEGLFLAVLRKAGERNADAKAHGLPMNEPEYKKSKRGKEKQGGKNATAFTKEQQTTARTWLADADTYEFFTDNNLLTAFPQRYADVLPTLRNHLRILHAGIRLAELKGRDLLPCHALAMSVSLHPNAFPRQELTIEQAIAYLRKEAITLHADTPRGIVLVTYRHLPLGFVKNVGNRANNLYPQEWRIRSGHLPEEMEVV